MKLTIKELTAFSKSYQEIKDEKMPLSLAYDLSKISKEVGECFEFYRDKYNQYLSLYAELDEEGHYKLNKDQTQFILKTSTILEAKEKFEELDKYEFSINVKKIPINCFEKINMSPQSLSGLLPFIEE